MFNLIFRFFISSLTDNINNILCCMIVQSYGKMKEDMKLFSLKCAQTLATCVNVHLGVVDTRSVLLNKLEVKKEISSYSRMFFLTYMLVS